MKVVPGSPVLVIVESYLAAVPGKEKARVTAVLYCF